MNYNTTAHGASDCYPESPGYRRNAPDTSREAAEAITTMARNHREQVLAVIKAIYPDSCSSDEIAKAIGLSLYSVRSRVSELQAAGKIERTEDRAKNDGGRSVVLWRAA